MLRISKTQTRQFGWLKLPSISGVSSYVVLGGSPAIVVAMPARTAADIKLRRKLGIKLGQHGFHVGSIRSAFEMRQGLPGFEL